MRAPSIEDPSLLPLVRSLLASSNLDLSAIICLTHREWKQTKSISGQNRIARREVIEADPSIADPDHTCWHVVGDVSFRPELSPLVVDLDLITIGQLSRFCVGVVQMIVLFAVGWIAFDISLGPQPLALLLPIAGIAFAGAAFGLLVAAVAPSRDSVLPVGSAVAIAMAAIGGCWWPIDLEPRWMRQLSLGLPTRWAMEAFNDLMIRRRGLEAALRPSAVMAAFGVLYLLAGMAIFRRRLRRS